MTIQPTDSQALDSQGTDSQLIDNPVIDNAVINPAIAEGDPGTEPSTPTEPPPSYVKLAMRNMVRKRGTSLYHFALTTAGLLAVLVGLAYITR